MYLIEILHQTTTLAMSFRNTWGCILSKFYIKPQPGTHYRRNRSSCILSKFYIKPQPLQRLDRKRNVVSYRNSTSNHNLQFCYTGTWLVVSYRNSTSNHNENGISLNRDTVVSYRNSTSNHNFGLNLDDDQKLYLIEILHQTTTLAC